MAKSTGKSKSKPSKSNQNRSSSKGKRDLNGVETSITNDLKRRKLLKPFSEEKKDKLAQLIVDFNLARNELFQLREYKTIHNWNPLDFSEVSSKSQISELYQSFIENNKLDWDNKNNNESLKDLPLRFQKKILAEREQKLLEKFPFKPEVLERAKILESNLLHRLEIENFKPNPRLRVKIPQPKLKLILKREKKDSGPEVVEEKVEILHEELKESDNEIIEEPLELESLEESIEPEVLEPIEPEIQRNYSLKSVRYSLPTPLVTHPSHIPAWRPEHTTDNAMTGSNVTQFSYTPTKYTIVKTKTDRFEQPNIQEKIRNHIINFCKTPIIDESNLPDYSFTKEEFDLVTLEQEENFKKINDLIVNKNFLELKGEKIEKKKIILPSNADIRPIDDPFRLNGSIIPRIQGSGNSSTYQDHFIKQALHFAKLHDAFRKQRMNRAKKIAIMIDQHFKKKSGEKERLAREQEQNLRKIGRLAIQAVKKRWTQASKVYAYMQQEKEEELKQIKGREHLSQMLEHSTQLLEAQLQKSSHDVTEAEESDSGDEKSDSENFSSSDDSDDDEESEKDQVSDKVDLELSVADLKKKYANLKESSVSELERESTVEPSNGIKEQRKEDTADTSDPGSHIEDDEDVSEDKGKVSLADLFTNNTNENDSSDASAAELYNSGSEVSSGDEDENMSSTDEEIEPESPQADEDHDMELNGKADVESAPEVEFNGTMVRDVPLPPLLKGTLRPYQKQGLNWLASLYNNETNGILADEMGLGKTIQTIALISYLANEHHIWGPHLIVVPTSVMLNWEMEFKKFAPGFKVMTYYGSPQERARKRKGWNKPDSFHVCITSYQLVVHDQPTFKRKKWKYMILDEAHNIKNFRSTRWKALLNFNTENRLLLTGTPLQNSLIELWSLLYFLMPSSKATQSMPEGFANLEDFQQWFGKPVDRIMEQATLASGGDVIDENERTTSKMDEETRNTVARLHQVLRPYILRRLKKDVEKQMPGKYEHIIYCRLSKRQRFLYDDFMTRAKTKETLISGNFLSIINCLMQLRKVCNHPDLFEVRPVVTSYAMPKSVAESYNSVESIVRRELSGFQINLINLDVLNLDLINTNNEDYFVAKSINNLQSSKQLKEQIEKLDILIKEQPKIEDHDYSDSMIYHQHARLSAHLDIKSKLEQVLYLNTLRCERSPIYSEGLINKLRVVKNDLKVEAASDLIRSVPEIANYMGEIVDRFSMTTPPVVALDMKDQLIPLSTQHRVLEEVANNNIDNPYHRAQVKLSVSFPDKQLLQFDCGKLQKLATLLQDLVAGGHRALIFTQMTKVLDILEQFLNIHGYRYMRLDGSTKIEDRQLLTEKFNRDNKIPVFILSTRSGGLGINLTGADTVIFYDSDWNPAMDKQCQDRCHRIGQTRDVHIYRFVSEYTIESNILKKANQKRQLDNVVIQEGEFTTDYFSKFSVRDLVNDTSIVSDLPDKPLEMLGGNTNNLLAQAEDEEDRVAASAAMKEVVQEDEDFDDENKPVDTIDKETPVGPAGSVNDGDGYLDVDFAEGVGHIDEYMIRFISEGNYS